MNFLPFIESKREGKILAPEQIQKFIREFTAGKIPDYQMAAMLMAIYFRGLNTAETTALTLAMRDSGDVLKFPKDKRPLVDKHSTGGIGDKVSLPLAPLLACLGFRVPMISGRGLGITGGTLDKLDSILGFKTLLPAAQIISQVQKVGCVICGQTDTMVPADKKIYALRDASGTVPSIPLIVASILSKKLAESLDALILDVKFGNAAFMQTKADARKLAKAMVALGNDCGVNTRAILSDMNTPLGRAAGNWLEVKESVDCLESSAAVPAAAPKIAGGTRVLRSNDMRQLVLDCAAHLLVQTRKARLLQPARKIAEDCLNSGAPRKKFDEMLFAQGADLKAFNKKLSLDSTAPVILELKSPRAGFVTRCDARIIGETIRDLGGGRLTKDSIINYDVGVDKMAKPGERVEKNSILARIHATDKTQATTALFRIQSAFEISTKPEKVFPLISEIITLG
ncbi:MAG TPA: thymidine phosphorylase [Verrucomicrobiae bacterium]|jgi:pyrimidine-nucleoside phosphorylase|nr:thymidine phosphorylase [Verrucomicrobiae bacterium]